MGRLIDVDNLKERARHWWDCTPQSTSDFVDFVDAEPTAQQWIPVTEQLPEEGKDVIICIKHNGKSKMLITRRSDYNYWDGIGRDIIGEMRWTYPPKEWEE